MIVNAVLRSHTLPYYNSAWPSCAEETIDETNTSVNVPLITCWVIFIYKNASKVLKKKSREHI